MKTEMLSDLVSSGDLDHMVHAAAALQAQEVNNKGADAQLTYLIRRGMAWQKILELAEITLSVQTHRPVGPEVFPEARLVSAYPATLVAADDEVYHLAWHAASEFEGEGGKIIPADDCNDMDVVSAFESYNSLPDGSEYRVLMEDKSSGIKYLPIWIHESREDEYQSPDQ